MVLTLKRSARSSIRRLPLADSRSVNACRLPSRSTVLLMTIQGPPVECLIVLIITWMRQLQGGLFGIYDICPPRCHSFQHVIGNPCLTCCVRSCEVTTIEHSSPDAKPAGQTKTRPDLVVAAGDFLTEGHLVCPSS